MKAQIYLFTLVVLLLVTVWPTHAHAGDKVDMIYINTGKVKKGTLLVAPILPDPFVMKKLSKPGKEAQLALYQERLNAANENLKEALSEYYEFCPFIFLDTVPAMNSYDTYYEHLATYDKSKFYVLQFGYALQFRTDPPNKIRRYERDVLGIYRADGKTQLLIFPGVPKHCWKVSYAFARVATMQSMLVKYYEKGRKKGLIKKGG